MSKWNFEKDAYGDPAWVMKELGVHKELRVYPTQKQWGGFLLTADSEYSRSSKKRKLKEGTKDEVIEYLKKYILKRR